MYVTFLLKPDTELMRRDIEELDELKNLETGDAEQPNAAEPQPQATFRKWGGCSTPVSSTDYKT